MEKYACVILAAGKGTRMNEGSASPIPKVMFEAAGRPLVWHGVTAIKKAGVKLICLIVGYKKELVMDYFGDEVKYAEQKEQLGTGHAVGTAKDLLTGKSEAVIVFYGDNPLYKPETIKTLIDVYEKEKPTIAMLSVMFKDPNFWSFGRILRDEKGEVTGIKEQKDCTEEELKVAESNPGFYIFESKWLWENIGKIGNENAQREYYLTDLIEAAHSRSKRIVAVPVREEMEALGVNTPEQLIQAEIELKNRK